MLGYAQGQKLADQILETNRARLDRDYMGMLRYSELLNKGDGVGTCRGGCAKHRVR